MSRPFGHIVKSATIAACAALGIATTRADCPGAWLPGEGLPGVDGHVRALTTWDADGPGPQPELLVVGGHFAIAGNTAANHVAAWNGTHWQALGSGLGGPGYPEVFALAVYNGALIAAGRFTTAGQLSANCIAQWDGTAWAALGSGMNDEVEALAVYDGALVAGGRFTTAGGHGAACIAKWDGANWSALGSGMSASVAALAVYDGALIAGGNWADHIAKWNGTNWTPLGNGANAPVAALATFGGALLAAGQFSEAGGIQAHFIAQWNGTSWTALGDGLDAPAAALTVYGDTLVAGGEFSQAGGEAANFIAQWNGTNWAPLGDGTGTAVYALAVYGTQLIPGGAFPSAGNATVFGVASWNGTNWASLGGGWDAAVRAAAVYNSELIAGGSFSSAGGVSANRIAKWNGSSWAALGSGVSGGDDVVAALTEYDGALIAGGSFTTAGGASANRIAKWDGLNWTDLGGGVGGAPAVKVSALAVFNGELIAGGDFATAGGDSASRIARWNGTIWAPLGSGMNGKVEALTVYNGELIAGGWFTTAGGSSANYIAKWDGTSWTPLGSGMDRGVYSLTVCNGALIAAGTFTTAGGASAAQIAQWNGTSWAPLGGGANSSIHALTVRDGELFAGGSFTLAGGLSANRIAKWNGTNWAPLDSGMGGSGEFNAPIVYALTVRNAELIAGGGFTTAGGLASAFWARWGSAGAAPIITLPPADRAACVGDSATFAVVAEGTPPITYQWRHDGIDVPGATSATLIIDPITLGDAGAYDVVVTNECGSVTSTAATLIVHSSPAITQQPASQTRCAGESATFSVTASGSPPPSYQWRKNGASISGATGSSYTITAVTIDDAGSYDCVATNVCGSATSDAATLTVQTGPSLAEQPQGQAPCVGQSVTFSVTATGTPPLSYQWRKNGSPISGATDRSYTIAAVVTADAGDYDCVVTNMCASATSAAATLTVQTSPTIPQSPDSQTRCVGQPATFGVMAEGSPPLSYQWRKDGVDIAGATNLYYVIGSVALSDAGEYDCVVGNMCGSAISDAATLTVNTLSTAATGAAADPSTICAGESATLSVEGGFLGTGAAWKWYSGDCGGTYAGTGPSLAVAPVVTTTFYVRAEGACNTTACASVVVIVQTLSTAPTSAAANPSEICPGLSSVLTVQGGVLGSGAEWKWYVESCGGTFLGDGPALSVSPSATATYYVRAEGTCNTTTCASVTVTVNAGLSLPANVQANPATLCGSGSAELSATVAAGETVIWYAESCGGPQMGVGTTITVQAATTTTYYARTWNPSTGCTSVDCAAATVTVNAGPTIREAPVAQTACAGQPVTFSVVADGSPPPSYQWRHATQLIPGATEPAYTIPAVAIGDAGQYDVTVTNSCGSITSTPVALTVNAGPEITSQPQPQTVCPGQPAAFHVVAAGAGALSYQWRKDGLPLAGQTASRLALDAVTPADAGSYDVVVHDACTSAASDGAWLTVHAGPVIATPPISQTACAGGSATFSVVAGGSAPLGFQWRKDNRAITGATQATYTIHAVHASDAGTYDVVVTNVCGLVTSPSATLACSAGPLITSGPQPQTDCLGGSATFTVTATGTPPLSFQWHQDGADLPGETAGSLTIGPLAAEDAGDISVSVANSCGSITSSPAALAVGGAVITDPPQSQTVRAGNQVTFRVATAGAGPLTYQWRRDGVALGGATGDQLAVVSAGLSDAGAYDVVLTSPCGRLTSPPASLAVTPAAPDLPAPADKATRQPISADLDWGDTYGATSYDVYCGTDPDPHPQGTATESAWALPPLAYGTTYYWKIVARNEAGTTPGPTWSFSTVPPPLSTGGTTPVGEAPPATVGPQTPADTAGSDTGAGSSSGGATAQPDPNSQRDAALEQPVAPANGGATACGASACGGGLLGVLPLTLLSLAGLKLRRRSRAA